MRRGRRKATSHCLTIQQISQKLGVHPNTIRNWIKRDGLRAEQRGKTKQYYIHILDLKEFLLRIYPEVAEIIRE